MRKLVMLISVVGFGLPVATGVAGPGQPLPPIQPGPQGAQLVVKGVLSNYVAPTAALNGSVDVTIASSRILGQLIQRPSPKLRVVLTPQTKILGVIVNGRPGIVKVKRQAQWIHAQLVALEVATIGQGTQDPDDGTPICFDEECVPQ
jgi:hypothetical protein